MRRVSRALRERERFLERDSKLGMSMKPREPSEEEVRMVGKFPTLSSRGLLMCAAGTLNNFAINYTTGQGRLQGFALKAALVLGLKHPRGKLAADDATGKRTIEVFYAAAHPVSKRNMLFVLDHDIENLEGAWVPGFPPPVYAMPDNFVKLRLNSIPAGARKIYIRIEACKGVTTGDMLLRCQVRPGKRSGQDSGDIEGCRFRCAHWGRLLSA